MPLMLSGVDPGAHNVKFAPVRLRKDSTGSGDSLGL
jgi:hypothetical protein